MAGRLGGPSARAAVPWPIVRSMADRAMSSAHAVVSSDHRAGGQDGASTKGVETRRSGKGSRLRTSRNGGRARVYGGRHSGGVRHTCM